MSANLPYRRFREDPATPADVLDWLKTHRYIWYKAPMDFEPRKVYLTSKVTTWKRDPARFSFGVETNAGWDNLRFRVDNDHLDRIMIPNPLWWHGITAHACHEHKLSSGFVSHASKGYIRQTGRYRSDCGPNGVEILSTYITIHQSNGFWLTFDKLSHAINFCRRKNIRLTVGRGRRFRVLVAERPMSGEVAA